MTIRGGGNPHTAMAAMPLGEWTRRLGALLAEAYDCFMVGTLHGSTEYKRGSRAIARGQWQAPLGSSRGRPPDHGQFAAVLASVKDKPSAARIEQKNGVNNARQKWRDAPLTKKAPYKPYAGKPDRKH